MKEKLLNVKISCQLTFDVQSDDLHDSQTDFSDLQTFLSDLQDNLELLDLIKAGEIVETDNFELTPSENSLIAISRFSDRQSPFYLSCDTLKSISNTLSLYDLNEKLLKVGVGFENRSDTLRETEVFNPSVTSVPERSQNSILDINIKEQNLSNFGSVIVNKDTVNDDSDIIAGNSPTDPVSHFEGFVDNNKLDSMTSVNLNINSYPESTDNKKHPSNHITNMNDTNKHKNTGHQTTDSEIQRNFDKRSGACAVDSLIAAHVYSDFLDAPREPDDDLPPPELNTTATLKEYLLKKGSDSALSSLKSECFTHKTALNPVFSYELHFVIGSVKHIYKCCTRFARKSDARRHVEYKACQALGMSWRDGGEFRFFHSKESPNQSEAKRNAAYRACKSLGLCPLN
ncbi:hypothetical protein ACHWQZ_G012835 [Mnemiopsis leidyi]